MAKEPTLIIPEGNNKIDDLDERLTKLEKRFTFHNHADGYTQPVWVGKVNQGSANIVIPPSGGVLGEDVHNGDALRMGMTNAPKINQLLYNAGVDVEYASGDYVKQSFTTGLALPLTKIRVYFSNSSTDFSFTVTLELYDSSFSTILASADATLGTSVSDVPLDFIFSPAYNVESNTLYWMKIYLNTTSNTAQILYYNNGGIYSGGELYRIANGNLEDIGDAKMSIFFQEDASAIYKASSATQDEVDRYIGIANQDGLTGEDANFVCIGFKTDYSGLTTGSAYYLTDTPGVIGTTPGTITQRIGYAYSDTILGIFK